MSKELIMGLEEFRDKAINTELSTHISLNEIALIAATIEYLELQSEFIDICREKINLMKCELEGKICLKK